MGLTYVVYIAKDVSVRIVGSIESAYRTKSDANNTAERLSKMYRDDGAFAALTLPWLVPLLLPPLLPPLTGH